MSRLPADRSGPIDLGAINRSGELIDALSTRAVSAEHADDPAVRLLSALTADVDVGAPPLRTARGRARPRRRSVRAFVALGVASVVLTTAGVAAAGGGRHFGGGGEHSPRQAASDRSNMSTTLSTPHRGDPYHPYTSPQRTTDTSHPASGRDQGWRTQRPHPSPSTVRPPSTAPGRSKSPNHSNYGNHGGSGGATDGSTGDPSPNNTPENTDPQPTPSGTQPSG